MSVLYIVIICFCFSVGLTSCGASEDEIWREKVMLEDGSHIMLYHSNDCTCDRPFFCPKEKKVDFYKLKYDVYASCIDNEEAEMLNAISHRNIQKYRGYIHHFGIGEDLTQYWERLKISDDSDRTYSVEFALKNNTLVKITPPINFQNYERRK